MKKRSPKVGWISRKFCPLSRERFRTDAISQSSIFVPTSVEDSEKPHRNNGSAKSDEVDPDQHNFDRTMSRSRKFPRSLKVYEPKGLTFLEAVQKPLMSTVEEFEELGELEVA